MEYQDNFEIVYEVDGIPITLYEIEEWWNNAHTDIKKSMQSPDNGRFARESIARHIVNDMKRTFSQDQINIIARFEKNKRETLDSLSNMYDGIFNRRQQPKIASYEWQQEWEGLSNPRREYYYQPAPELPPIQGESKDDILRNAMRMANEKIANQHRHQVPPKQQNKPIPPTPQPIKKSWRVVLGLSSNEPANKETIVKKFRELARKYHPDVYKGPDTMMKEILTARDDAFKEIT